MQNFELVSLDDDDDESRLIDLLASAAGKNKNEIKRRFELMVNGYGMNDP